MGQHARDSQKQQVYEFEEEIAALHDIKGEQLTLSECQDMVAEICSQFAVNPPEVKDGRGCKSAFANELWITLPKQFRNMIGVVHECCHVICDIMFDCDRSYHDSIFVRYFIEILASRSTHLTLPYLEHFAQISHVQVAPPADFCALPPGVSGKLLSLYREADRCSAEFEFFCVKADDARSVLAEVGVRIDDETSAARLELFS